MRKSIILVAVLLTVSGFACGVRTPNPVVFQRQRLRNVPYRAVLDAAEQALGRHFRIEQRDDDAGIVRASPAESVLDPTGTRIISDRLGTPRHARRVAEVHVRVDGPYIDVYCRVLVQELETARFRVMERERGVYDQPTDTPAEGEAGTTPEQNAVWLNRSRDRVMERQILAGIQARVRRPPAEDE